MMFEEFCYSERFINPLELNSQLNKNRKSASFERVLTDNVSIKYRAEDCKKLNTLVVGGYGPSVISKYIQPNILRGNSSFVLLDFKGETLARVRPDLIKKRYKVVTIDLVEPDRFPSEEELRSLLACCEEKYAIFLIAGIRRPDADDEVYFFYQAFVPMLLKHIDDNLNGKSPMPIHFIVDEFVNYCDVPLIFRVCMPFFASHNISVSILIASFSQLRHYCEQYNEDWRFWLGASEMMLVNTTDVFTAKIISELVGEVSCETKTYGGKRRRIKRALIEPEELYLLENDRVLLLVAGNKPCFDTWGRESLLPVAGQQDFDGMVSF